MSLQISVVEPPSDAEPTGEDVCASLKCQPGERCVILDGQPTCDCIDICEFPKDDRQRVSCRCVLIMQSFDRSPRD